MCVCRYLGELKAFPEVCEHDLTVIELPLLAGEVTGPTNILAFSQKLVGPGYRSVGDEGPKTLEGWTPTEWAVRGVGGGNGELAQARRNKASEAAAAAASQFSVGDRVRIDGLANAPEFNGYTGKVVEELNENGRVGVAVIFKAARKKLALKPDNLTLVADEEQRGEKRSAPGGNGAASSNPLAGMMAGLMEDPDVQEALKNPKVKAAYDDVVANGMMAGMKYFGDPDCAPVIQKIMGKMGMGGMMGGGSAGGGSGGGGGGPPDLSALLGALGGQPPGAH